MLSSSGSSEPTLSSNPEEVIKQEFRIVWAARRLRMKLHGKERLRPMADPLVRSIIEVHEPRRPIMRKACHIHRVAVVLAGQIGPLGANIIGTLDFTVPFNGQNTGAVRFRIRGGDDIPMNATQACGASNSPKGEGEDYDVTITNPPACNGTPTAGTTTASIAVSTSGTPFDLGLSGLVSQTGLTFQYSL